MAEELPDGGGDDAAASEGDGDEALSLWRVEREKGRRREWGGEVAAGLIALASTAKILEA